MNTQIDDIIDELYNKYHGVERNQISSIVKLPWKLVQETISAKQDTVVNIMYLGKIKPTPFRIKQLKQSIDEQA
jgi:hypothetical protein